MQRSYSSFVLSNRRPAAAAEEDFHGAIIVAQFVAARIGDDDVELPVVIEVTDRCRVRSGSRLVVWILKPKACAAPAKQMSASAANAIREAVLRLQPITIMAHPLN